MRSRPRRDRALGRARDFRPIGKNCELGRLGPATSHFLHEPELPTVIPSRPIDATLSVTKAARLLGVHPNTIRAWSDAGRLRYYRINPRGDRRYRLGDLQRFLAAAESGLPEGATDPGTSRRGHGRPRLELLPPVGRGERATRESLRVAAPPGRVGARAGRRRPPGRRSKPARRADPDRRLGCDRCRRRSPRRPPRSATTARTGPSRCSSSAASGSIPSPPPAAARRGSSSCRATSA